MYYWSLHAILLILVAACGASGDSGNSGNSGESAVSPSDGGTTNTNVPDAGVDSGPDPPADAASACNLNEITDATPVKVEFVNLAPPTVVAPRMTGGATAGRFRVVGARVYLPKETASFTDPAKSSGTVTAWSIFQGSEYRIHINLDLVVKAKLGADQIVKQTSDSQGKFTVTGERLTFDQSCDAKKTAQPEYSFTNSGTAVTIVIKAKVGPTNSDSYTELQAVPE